MSSIRLKNIAVGIDIESVSRFKDLEKNKRFLTNIFTEKEVDYCFSKKKPSPHLAARFAAKEAVFKALCSMGHNVPDYTQIEVGKKKNGTPFLNVYKEGIENLDIAISMSHCEDKAIAIAIINKQNVKDNR